MQVFCTTTPCFIIKKNIALKSIKMIYIVFLNCKQLVWGINKYQNKLFASRNIPLCYLCHLRYMCNYTLQNNLCLIVSFDNLDKKYLYFK